METHTIDIGVETLTEIYIFQGSIQDRTKEKSLRTSSIYTGVLLSIAQTRISRFTF